MHCLRKFEAHERALGPDPCSMCQDREATTTWGLPVCQPCADFLTRLDAQLKAEFPEPTERYIDRARRAIRQRRVVVATEQSDDTKARS